MQQTLSTIMLPDNFSTMHITWTLLNRPFPSSKKLHFQSDAKCEAIDMKMIFNCDANKTHFHNKGFALSLVLKVRFFGTRKWPIYLVKGIPPPKKKPFVSYVLYIACVQLSPPLKKKETDIIWGEGMVVHTLWCGIPPVSLVIFLIHVITPQKLRVRKLHIQTLMDPHPVINPLSPKSDQHQFSPHNINALAKVKVMRFNKMIISGKMLWSITKFSQLIF